MKKRVLRIVCLVLPILALIIFTNVYVDPANLYHDVASEVASNVLAGKSVFVTSGNLDERHLKKAVIEGMPKEGTTIVLGPSFSMGISTGEEGFYNLAMSAADYYDYLAVLGIMEYNGKHADKVILTIDSYCFNRKFVESFTAHTALKEYSQYMLDILNGVDTKTPGEHDLSMTWQRVLQSLSVTYFQGAVDMVKANGSLKAERVGLAESDCKSAYYRSDASYAYDEVTENATFEYHNEYCGSYNLDFNLTQGVHIDSEYADTFDRLIKYLQDNGTEVELFLSPVSPSLWDSYDATNHPLMAELADYATTLSDKYGVKIIGSYNPYDLGLTDADFCDIHHLRNTSLSIFEW